MCKKFANCYNNLLHAEPHKDVSSSTRFWPGQVQGCLPARDQLVGPVSRWRFETTSEPSQHRNSQRFVSFVMLIKSKLFKLFALWVYWTTMDSTLWPILISILRYLFKVKGSTKGDDSLSIVGTSWLAQYMTMWNLCRRTKGRTLFFASTARADVKCILLQWKLRRNLPAAWSAQQWKPNTVCNYILSGCRRQRCQAHSDVRQYVHTYELQEY